MDWKTFDWKNQKIGKKGNILTKTTYKCGFCMGTGIAPCRRNIPCPVCSGQGIVNVSPPAVICAYCNGQGKSYLNKDLSCIVCRGKGVVAVENKNIETCLDCNGKGRERGGLPCLICKGKGVVLKR
ncbi:MAG: hypothetical protein ABIJ30_03470 [bacterium]